MSDCNNSKRNSMVSPYITVTVQNHNQARLTNFHHINKKIVATIKLDLCNALTLTNNCGIVFFQNLKTSQSHKVCQKSISSTL